MTNSKCPFQLGRDDIYISESTYHYDGGVVNHGAVPNIIKESYQGYFNYLIDEISHFHWSNYFYGLIIVSIGLGIKILFPWRKEQGIFRKDFWMDAFYMFSTFPVKPFGANRTIQYSGGLVQ